MLMHVSNTSVSKILDLLEGGNQSAMARKTKLTQPTIGRIASGKTIPELEKLESIARGYGFDVWQLLVPGLDPKHPPLLRFASQTEEALYKKFKALQADLANLK